MRVEVINTGTELLLGHVINTHVGYFGTQLLPLGLRIQRQTTIPDGDDIALVLREAFSRSDLILVTGGLGPTSDDVTREVIADMLELDMDLDEEVLHKIHTVFRRFGREMPESNKRQAMVPRGATVLKNPNGTAPGLYFPAKEGTNPHIFVMPGPPRELTLMYESQVHPVLADLVSASSGGPPPSQRTFRIIGAGESHIAEALDQPLRDLGDLEIGYCARMGEVDLRLIGSMDLIDRGDALIRKSFPRQLISSDGSSLEETVVRLLGDAGQWVCTAESCTGGFLANRFTNVPGASAVFRQGYVTYANEAKSELLEVPPALIEEHGAVSEPVARAMADGALRQSGVDHALATTGIAGPGGGSREKPVGTVFIAVASKGSDTFVKRFCFTVDRLSFKDRAARMALDLLRRRLLGIELED